MTTQTTDRDYVLLAKAAVNDLAEALRHIPGDLVPVMVQKLLLQIDYTDVDLSDETENPFVIEEPEWISMNDKRLSSFNERLYAAQGAADMSEQLHHVTLAVELLGAAVATLERKQHNGITDTLWQMIRQEARIAELEQRIAFQATEWELDEYLATHDVFALHTDERLDAKALAKTMKGLRDTPTREVIRILAKRGWEWSFIARSMRTTPDAPDEWSLVDADDVAAIYGGMDYPTNI